MRQLFKIISFIGLALTIVPSMLVYLGQIDLAANKNLMFTGTCLWFATAPFWMNKKKVAA